MSHATRFVLILAMLGARVPAAAQDASDYALFADDTALDLRISGPFQTLWRNNDDDETEYDATLEYVDTNGERVAIDIAVRLRGLSRRYNCDFAPLRLDFPRSRVQGTVFAGQNRIKLVSMCGRGTNFEDYVIQEYLIYRALNLLTDRSFKVRRANIEYVYNDTRRERSMESPAFLIEEDWAVAERLGLDVIETERVARDSLDAEYTTLIAVFQFMIGNPDWAVLRGPDETCCHNGKVMGADEGPFIVVPYDFDNAGLIYAEYAAPPDSLRRRISSVRQRLYWGFCAMEPQLDDAIATIGSHRDELMDIFDSELLSSRARRSTVSYLDQFFAIIDDPDRREAQFDGRGNCDDAAAQVEPGISDIERVVAVADIHGAYDAFAHILRRAELIDASNSWSGERTHLVIVGDVLDRGAESRRALDLIRRLETEAEAAGGRVHFVLGNHEIMNLAGDLRYVAPGEYAAFADEEPLELRDRERARYIEALGTSTSPDDASAMFDEAYPLGFFAHRAAFAHDGEYGEWLLGKPVLKVVNGVAFVHGGLTGAMLEHGSDLNSVLMSELEDVLVARDNLIEAGVLSPTSGLYELPLHAQALLEQQQQEDTLSPALQASLEQLLAVDSLVSFAPDGPVWYRGNVGCNRLTERDRLEAALRAVGAERLVVGHTPTRGAVVLSRMSESLLRIDTGMLSNYYGGRASALVIENGALSVLYEDEAEPSVPLAQPRRVGTRAADLSAEDIEVLLRGANFTLPTPFEAGATYVRVVDGDRELRALFTVAEDDDRNGAVAAYRLDRLLGLDMVPVTVAREVSGVVGALQFWPVASIDETERSTERLGGGAWCPLPDQFRDMYLFDALIFNEARSADRIRYSTDNFGLLLVANDQTFAAERERPAYLANVPVELTPAWRAALEGLTEEDLTAALGDVLDRRRIRAILARRDHLLEIAH